MTGHGLTDVELARLAGLSEGDVARLRTGDVRSLRLSTLDGLCRALGCCPGDVLDYVLDGDEG